MTTDKKLQWAIRLFSVDLVLGLVVSLVNTYVTYQIVQHFSIGTLVGAIISTALYAFVIWQIYLQKNWARIVSLVVFIISVIATIIAMIAFNFTVNYWKAEASLNGHVPPSAYFVIMLIIIPIIQRVLEAISLRYLYSREVASLFKDQV